MTARALLRWAAGFALALLVAAAWTTPGEAHPGHSRASGVSSGQAGHNQSEVGHAGLERDAATTSERGAARSQAADPAMEAARRDCGGHQAGADGQGKPCCSNACHAVMSTDLSLPMIVSTIPAGSPSSAEPAAHAGPGIYIKRPPRSSAA